MIKPITIREDIHVRVDPRRLGDFGFLLTNMFGEHTEAEAIRLCEDIAAQIRRHCDDLPSSRDKGVYVMWEARQICPLCKRDWELEDGIPQCCDAAMDSMLKPPVPEGG